MKVEMYLVARDGSYNAKAVYDDGSVTVKAGTKIRTSFASHVRGGRAVKKYRDDVTVVDVDGYTLKDCAFSSPSTAAQFVMGSSVNGWSAWHIDRKTNLKKHIESVGGQNGEANS